MNSIGIIGFGNMGEAFAAGLRARFPRLKFLVVEKIKPRTTLAKERFDAEDCAGQWDRFFSQAEVVILAVKPQDADTLLREISPYSKGGKFVSIMAGKTIPYLRRFLETPFLARLMPNLAAMHGKAAVGVSFFEEFKGAEMEGFQTTCVSIAEAVGKPIQVPERLMPMMTALSGSGIAFVFQFIHAMAMGGVKTGFSYPAALETTLQVVEGAVEVVRSSGESPSEWITRVASPAGTTIEGLKVLEEGAFTAFVMGAVEAASKRAEELEGK